MQYDSVPIKRLKYSRFDGLSKRKTFTGDFGLCYPVYCKETVPGDIWRIKNGHKTLIMPQISPLNSDVYLNTFACFVPNRLTDELFPKFLKGLNSDDSEYNTPLKSIQDVYTVWKNDPKMMWHDVYDYCVNNGFSQTCLLYKSQSFTDSNLVNISDPVSSTEETIVDLFMSAMSSFDSFYKLVGNNWQYDGALGSVLRILPFCVGNVFDFLQYPTVTRVWHSVYRVAFWYDNTKKQLHFNAIFVPSTQSGHSWELVHTGTQETAPFLYCEYNGSTYKIDDFLSKFSTDYILPTRFFAYWYFYDDWFAHPDFDTPVACRWLRKGDLGVPDDEFELLEDSEVPRVKFTLFSILWHKDYFTASLKTAQRGTPPALPISITGQLTNLNVDSQLTNLDVTSRLKNVLPAGSYSWSDYVPHSPSDTLQKVTNKSTGKSSIGIGISNSGAGKFDFVDAGDSLDIETTLNGATIQNTVQGNVAGLEIVSFDISDFRFANAIQRFQELNNLAGRRWTDFLKIQYGTSPSDDILERPDYFGRDRTPVSFGQVDSTVSTSDDPLGTFAGRGSEAGIHSFRSYNPREQGTILVLACFTVRNGYMNQGIPREMLRKTRFDYYNSLFAGIGDQEVLTRELYNDYANDDPNNPSILGFEGRFDEYRVDQDEVSGNCRLGSFQTFTLNRWFNSAPSLDSELFTHMHIDKTRFLASPEDPTFICHFENYISVLRPMPERSIPQLGF